MGSGASKPKSSTNIHGDQVDNTIITAWENRNRFVEPPTSDIDTSNYFLRSDTTDTHNASAQCVSNDDVYIGFGHYVSRSTLYSGTVSVQSRDNQSRNSFNVEQLLNTVTVDDTNHAPTSSIHHSDDRSSITSNNSNAQSNNNDNNSAPPDYESVAFVKPEKLDEELPSYEEATRPADFYPVENSPPLPPHSPPKLPNPLLESQSLIPPPPNPHQDNIQ